MVALSKLIYILVDYWKAFICIAAFKLKNDLSPTQPCATQGSRHSNIMDVGDPVQLSSGFLQFLLYSSTFPTLFGVNIVSCTFWLWTSQLCELLSSNLVPSSFFTSWMILEYLRLLVILINMAYLSDCWLFRRSLVTQDVFIS